MAAFYHIDRERKLVMTTTSGVVTAKDLAGHMERLHKDPDFDPKFSQLADFTHLTRLEVTEADIHGFAQKCIFDPNSRRAFVVADDTSASLAETFARLRENAGEHGVRVFRTLDEGVNYILPRIASF
jgi:hypothetical protein